MEEERGSIHLGLNAYLKQDRQHLAKPWSEEIEGVWMSNRIPLKRMG